jgi:hypothetical protein
MGGSFPEICAKITLFRASVFRNPIYAGFTPNGAFYTAFEKRK